MHSPCKYAALLVLVQALLLLPHSAHSLKMHDFVNQPQMQHNGEAREPMSFNSCSAPRAACVKFSRAIKIAGADVTQLQVSQSNPQYLLFTSAANEAQPISATSAPWVKLLSSDGDYAQVEVFAMKLKPATADCRLGKLWQHYTAISRYAFPNYNFQAREGVAVMIRRPEHGAMGSVAEALVMTDYTDTYLHLLYSNETGRRLMVKIGSEAIPELPAYSTNTGLPGRWAFQISASSIRAAEYDAVAKQGLEAYDRLIGFFTDRRPDCKCQCSSNATCDVLAAGLLTIRSLKSESCCHCKPAMIGNGLECFSKDKVVSFSSEGEKLVTMSLNKGSLDFSVVRTNKRPEQIVQQLSAPGVAAAALLVAGPGSQSCRNLLGLSDRFDRSMQFWVRNNADNKLMASWIVKQTIYNQILRKTASIQFLDYFVDPRLLKPPGVNLGNSFTDQLANYTVTSIGAGSSRVVRATTESKVSRALRFISGDFFKLDLLFTDSWSFKPSCTAEVLGPILRLKYSYDSLATELSLRNVRGELSEPKSCSEVRCGSRRRCVTGARGAIACQCQEGFVEDSDGQCQPSCAGKVCHAAADCVDSRCVCRSGRYGDGFNCTADNGDCRLQVNRCPSGHQCQLAGGVSYRCVCISSKCKRGTDCLRFNCSRKASVCTQSQCTCPDGYRSLKSGSICLPLSCSNSQQCSDLGPLGFCNSSKSCETCPPPKVAQNGECVHKPCEQGHCHQLARCDASSQCSCNPGLHGDGYTFCRRNCSSVVDCFASGATNQSRSMQCSSSSSQCECKPGFNETLEAGATAMTCSNCKSDSDCMRGAACQISAAEGGARLCTCSEGKFGDGKGFCHECDAERSCGVNASCKFDSEGGNVCQCRFGFAGKPRVECKRLPTQLQLSNDSLVVYENQPRVEISCRIVQGPLKPAKLSWSTSHELSGSVSKRKEQRISQQLVSNSRLIVTISTVIKNDSKLYCISDEEASNKAVKELKLEVRPDPCTRCHERASCNYSLPGCQCKFGFWGNGVDSCLQANCLQQPALCNRSTEQCLFVANSSSAVGGGYHCQCLPGTRLVNGRCSPPPRDCIGDDDCHGNATCRLVQSRYSCRCRDGFSGDGKSSCQPQPISCRLINRCAANASCQFSKSDSQHRCVCLEGFVGDGDSLCDRSDECRVNSDCDADQKVATCQLTKTVQHRSLDGSLAERSIRSCVCASGFIKLRLTDGKLQCWSKAIVSTKLLLSFGDSVMQVAVGADGKGRQMPLLVSPEPTSKAYGKPVVAMARNCRTKELFLAALGFRGILKRRRNGDMLPIEGDFGSIEGLDVDWMSGNVFYSSMRVSDRPETKGQRFGEIGVVRETNGIVFHKVLLSGLQGQVTRPRAIAVLPSLGKLIYSDWDRSNPRLMEMQLNGEKQQQFYSSPHLLINHCAINFNSSSADLEVCFTAINANSQANATVQCTAANGSNVRQVGAAPFSAGHPYAIAYNNRALFWTDWLSKDLMVSDLASQRSAKVTTLFGSGQRLMAVTAATDECPTFGAEHPCSTDKNYGGCRQLCLAAGLGVTCECADSEQSCRAHVL